MLSKAKIKYLQALHQKKYRLKEEAFLVEGEKIIAEVLKQDIFNVHSIYATEAWVNKNKSFLSQYNSILSVVSSHELKKISALKTPNSVVAVVRIPNYTPLVQKIQTSLNLVLENIQDPGNMGTIIRIADWFGIPHIFCSKGCVDCYNPKVVQASMGGFLRVQIHYTNLETLLDKHPQLPVYGAVLGGNNVFEESLKQPAFLLIGNEGKGLSDPIKNHLSHRITIPRLGGAESLNAGVATGILCALFNAK
ncbi:TrmH family RNA methyltransferase [Aureispira anguillae]|uniref:RNA methyltransferase n=1 Tax=Aureispira anguillae TaxID=2864201 RepID=A0A916DU19_9BACT|nr:RNA methyltransferase [Aureispira anguillae]BDS12297.1 RNA methyltransferase [Aureispira anguillae]